MFEATFSVEWGDCDEAGIVFYPNFFYWLDCTFQRFLRAHELSHRTLKQRFGAVLPIIHAESDFKAPVRYDDMLVVRADVKAIGERRLQVDYDLSSGGRPVATAQEIRAWALFGENGAIKGGAIDPAFLTLCAIPSQPDRAR